MAATRECKVVAIAIYPKICGKVFFLGGVTLINNNTERV